MTIPVVGVDPGGRATGVITRSGDRLLYAATVTRDGTVAAYLAEVLSTVEKAVTVAITDQADDDVALLTPLVAVEDLNDPTPHLGLTSVRGLIGTAQVLGAVLCTYPTAILVPPGGHGSGLLVNYPPELVGPREKRGTGKSRHVRSAYDIARVGVYLFRMEGR